MLQRPGQVLLRFCVIWTRRKCFCTRPKVFTPKLYQKSKKQSDSFNESLNSGNLSVKSACPHRSTFEPLRSPLLWRDHSSYTLDSLGKSRVYFEGLRCSK